MLEAVRNRRRPNRFGWHYPEDYEPVGVDKDGNTYNNSEPTHVSGECFRAGSSFFIRHDLRYQDPYHHLMVSIHFTHGINGSNRMLVVTPEDQNVRAWVKIVQAMITDLLELNHDPSIVKVIGDVGEEGSYNVLKSCTATSSIVSKGIQSLAFG